MSKIAMQPEMSHNLHHLFEHRDPQEIWVELQESAREQRQFARACSFVEWLYLASRNLPLAVWMLRFTVFNIGQFPEELDVVFSSLTPTNFQGIQCLIDAAVTTLRTLRVNSTACEGTNPININHARHLQTLDITFDYILNLRGLRNRTLTDIILSTHTQELCKIENGRRFWQQCPNIKT